MSSPSLPNNGFFAQSPSPLVSPFSNVSSSNTSSTPTGHAHDSAEALLTPGLSPATDYGQLPLSALVSLAAPALVHAPSVRYRRRGHLGLQNEDAKLAALSIENWGRTFQTTPHVLWIPTRAEQATAILELARRRNARADAAPLAAPPSAGAPASTPALAGPAVLPLEAAVPEDREAQRARAAVERLAQGWAPVELRAVGRAHSPSDLMMAGPSTSRAAAGAKTEQASAQPSATRQEDAREGWMLRMAAVSGLIGVELQDSTDTLWDGSSREGSAGKLRAQPSVTVHAGTYISDIHAHLASAVPGVPLALSNVGSISEQTIGGLISTATHGTGIDYPVVSAHVLALDVAIPAAGPGLVGTHVVRCSRRVRPELFNATLCGLGCTGIILAAKLAVEPAFQLRQLSEQARFDFLFGPSVDGVDGLLRQHKQAPEPAPPSIAQLLARGARLPPPLEESGNRAKVADPARIYPYAPDAPSAQSAPTSSADLVSGIQKARDGAAPGAKSSIDWSSSAPATTSRAAQPSAAEGTAPSSSSLQAPAASSSLEGQLASRAQERIEQVVRSSQHVRIMWFPQVGMCTVLRADRVRPTGAPLPSGAPALPPTPAPGLTTRLYNAVVAHRLTELLLYAARAKSTWTPAAVRLIHRLTQPQPLDARQAKAISLDEPITTARIEESAEEQQKRRKRRAPEPEQSEADAALKAFAQPAGTARQAASALASGAAQYEHIDGQQITLTPRESPPELKLLHPEHACSASTTVGISHTVYNMDCLFPQYTDEWAIPFEHSAAAIRTLRDWLDEEQRLAKESGGPAAQVHFPIEIRFAAGDGIWLSHCHGRPTCFIGLVMYRPYNRNVRYRVLFAKFERLMRYYRGRPHWAKAHTCGPAELRQLYPHWDDFLEVREQADPHQVLVNPYVRRHLLGEIGPGTEARRFKARL